MPISRPHGLFLAEFRRAFGSWGLCRNNGGGRRKVGATKPRQWAACRCPAAVQRTAFHAAPCDGCAAVSGRSCAKVCSAEHVYAAVLITTAVVASIYCNLTLKHPHTSVRCGQQQCFIVYLPVFLHVFLCVFVCVDIF